MAALRSFGWSSLMLIKYVNKRALLALHTETPWSRKWQNKQHDASGMNPRWDQNVMHATMPFQRGTIIRHATQRQGDNESSKG